MPRVSLNLVDASSGGTLGTLVYDEKLVSEQALLARLGRLLSYDPPATIRAGTYQTQLEALRLGRDVTLDVPLLPRSQPQSPPARPDTDVARLRLALDTVRRALLEAGESPGPTQNPDLYAAAVRRLADGRQSAEEARDHTLREVRAALAQAGSTSATPVAAILELAATLEQERGAHLEAQRSLNNARADLNELRTQLAVEAQQRRELQRQLEVARQSGSVAAAPSESSPGAGRL